MQSESRRTSFRAFIVPIFKVHEIRSGRRPRIEPSIPKNEDKQSTQTNPAVTKLTRTFDTSTPAHPGTNHSPVLRTVQHTVLSHVSKSQIIMTHDFTGYARLSCISG